MFSMDRSIARGAVLRTELKTLTDEAVVMNKYRAYFDGEQELVYSTVLFQEIFGDAFEGFRDNWMKVIINACNNNIKLTNFHFDNDDDSEIAKRIWDVLKQNDINVQQKDLHEGTMIESRAFILVWPEPDGTGAQVDWQPGQLCRIYYDPDRRTKALWAVKRWEVDDGEIFVTFYTPEFVYKFRDTSASVAGDKSKSSSNALTEIPDVGAFGNLEERHVDGEQWPLPNPYGKVPIVEFNNPSYKSDLEDALPQQDALNKTLLDMLVTGEFQGFPQRAIETMSNAPEGGWVAGPGEVWAFKPSFDADGKHIPTEFHTFDVADPSTYMKPINMWLEHMAKTSFTPARYFLVTDTGGRGDAPSGEALLVDDKPLNDKIENKTERWGNRWLDVARLIAQSLKIDGAEELTGEAIWQDPRHDFRLSKLAEGAAMVDMGIPIEFAVMKVGFTPDEEIELLAMIEKQKLEAQEEVERAESIAAKRVADTQSQSNSQPSVT